mgnify:FL=1|jgi:hypothetical protein|tara:strand:- start:64 stop:390 length:327 start_codon:yes stop_codon:yes gene_type:complete
MTKYEDPIQPDWDSLKLSPLKMVTYLQIATLRAAFKQIAGEIQEFGGRTELQLDGVEFMGKYNQSEMERIQRRLAIVHDKLLDQFNAGGFKDASAYQLDYLWEEPKND